MTTTINNEHKKLNFLSEREQNQACLNSAEHEKNQGRKVLNVPNLRFPEFQGEWEKCILGDITENFNLRNKDKIQYPMFSVTNDRGFVPQSEQFEGRDMVGEDIKAYKIIHTNDFAYNPARINVGSIAMYTGEKPCMISSLYVCFKTTKEVNNEWLMQLLKTPKMNYYYNVNGEGGVRVYLFYPNFARIRMSIPKIEEQKKIAKLLNLIDERIATQNKIIDKLQSLIKGIMVELQKQGVNKGTWKKVFLSDVLTERNERNINLFQVFSVSVSQGVVNQVDYLGRSFAAKDTSKYNVVHYGDLVYTKSPTGSFPYGIVKQSLNLENVAVSPLYGVYKPKSLAVGAYLHEYFMSEINTHNYLHPLIQKGAKNTINITNQRFLENSVLLPTNINELLQISKLLRSLNNKIKYQQDILQQYQKQKQYLLRQMFI